MIKLLLIMLVFVCLNVTSCTDNEIVIGSLLGDASEIEYKYGEITISNDVVYENDVYTFKYVNPELDNALKAGFSYFPGFENLNKIYTSDVLFANIETRLPNVGRADYLEILNCYNSPTYLFKSVQTD